MKTCLSCLAEHVWLCWWLKRKLFFKSISVFNWISVVWALCLSVVSAYQPHFTVYCWLPAVLELCYVTADANLTFPAASHQKLSIGTPAGGFYCEVAIGNVMYFSQSRQSFGSCNMFLYKHKQPQQNAIWRAADNRLHFLQTSTPLTRKVNNIPCCALLSKNSQIVKGP